jgi:hypothetical protein
MRIAFADINRLAGTRADESYPRYYLNGKIMFNSTIEMVNERPFKPSWIDRFNNRVKKLPVSPWVFFSLFGLVLILVQLVILWLEDGLQEVDLLPVIIFNSLFTTFLIGLIYLLDHQAVAALRSMRSIIDTTESELKRYQSMLSNMPAGISFVAGLTMVGFTILLENLGGTPIRYDALEKLPIFTIIFQIIDKSSAFLFGVFFYHTIRQLRLVNTINVNHIRVNLFNLRPAQAFSKLTASTAVGLVAGVYGWMLINPELLANLVIFGFLIITTALALSVFALPLYGTHRLMEATKDRMLHEIDLRSETAFSQFNQGLRDNDNSAIDRLNGTIASLEIQYNRIKAIPTWPWKPETAQFALTAIALPLVLAALRFLVERTFG